MSVLGIEIIWAEVPRISIWCQVEDSDSIAIRWAICCRSDRGECYDHRLPWQLGTASLGSFFVRRFIEIVLNLIFIRCAKMLGALEVSIKWILLVWYSDRICMETWIPGREGKVNNRIYKNWKRVRYKSQYTWFNYTSSSWLVCYLYLYVIQCHGMTGKFV